MKLSERQRIVNWSLWGKLATPWRRFASYPPVNDGFREKLDYRTYILPDTSPQHDDEVTRGLAKWPSVTGTDEIAGFWLVLPNFNNQFFCGTKRRMTQLASSKVPYHGFYNFSLRTVPLPRLPSESNYGVRHIGVDMKAQSLHASNL